MRGCEGKGITPSDRVSMILLCLGAWLSCLGACAAQLPLRYENLGIGGGEVQLMAVRRGGDVDGDGFKDYLVGVPRNSAFALSNGAVRAFSGRDGSLLMTFYTPMPASPTGQLLGVGVCDAGDVDGDGYDDVAAVANNLNNVTLFVFSGATGSVIHSVGNIVSLSLYKIDNMGDLNGDGIDDLAVLVSDNATTAFRVYSGADLSVLYILPHAPGFDGAILRNAGDVNGDGVDDLIVGAFDYPATAPLSQQTGAVVVLSGFNGSVIHALLGPLPGMGMSGNVVPSQYGISVDGLGDLNGDGLSEFAVGAPGYGAIHVYSGADASLMATLVGSGPMDEFGQVLSRCGDVDGDGTPDLAAGASNWGSTGPGTPPQDAGRILVFSGVDFSLLFQVAGDQPNQRVGALVMGLGDLNGDGFPEIGCTINDSSVASNNGGVRVYSFGGIRRYGEGLGGLQTLNQIWFPGQAGDPALGAIVCNGAPPGAFGFLGVSLFPANTSVSGVPVLIDASPLQLVATSPILFDASGSYAALAPIRYPAFSGAVVFSQFFSLAPPFASSNGMEFLLLP